MNGIEFVAAELKRWPNNNKATYTTQSKISGLCSVELRLKQDYVMVLLTLVVCSCAAFLCCLLQQNLPKVQNSVLCDALR